MSLVSMKAILQKAREENYAVLATNLLNLEMLLGGIKAAELCESPLILQLAPVQFTTSPLHIFGPILIQAARNASVPVAVHLDHGFEMQHIIDSIDLGFTSVMFDGSSLEYEENIELTRQVVEYAKKYNVTVEAELGYVGTEGYIVDHSIKKYYMTQPDSAENFIVETGCDALAVAIGNAHGLYRDQPKLDFKLLAEIRNRTSIPLVLHGGSGTSEKDLQKCVELGICKVNLASDIQIAYMNSIIETKTDDFLVLSRAMIESTRNVVSRYMKILNSVGKAR